MTSLVAAAVFWVAYDNGAYEVASRASIAIAVWWALVMVVLFGLLPREPATSATLAIGGLIAGLALWTFASLLWAPSVEKTFHEFNRVTLYLGTFVLVTVASSRRNLGRWADGLALATVAVALVALTSRLFPGVFPEGDLKTFLPGAATRLSFPLGYWNGLAIYLALGVPLLLRLAVVARGSAARGLALAPIPVIASVIYLASSRGGFFAAFVGVLVFLALTERRWTAGTALVPSLLGSAAAITVLLERDELVNGPLGTDSVERQGRSAALLILAICVGTSAAYALGLRLLGSRLPRPPAVLGWVVVGAIAVSSVLAVAAADPVERFRAFKAPPGEAEAIDPDDFVTQHLLSAGGSGRWEHWSVAVDAWRDAPVLGQGAGTYEAWWSQHRPITLFVKDAHSLYLETLAELGPLGLGIVSAIVLLGLVVGVRRARGAEGDPRVTTAALSAVFAGYTAAAGFDWVWELTAVSVLAVAALALVSGGGAVAPAPLGAVGTDVRLPRRRHRFGLAVVALLLGWLLMLGQAVPLLAQREIAESQEAAEDGDLERATSTAAAARDIQPWASTPYLQLALVEEKAGDLRRARAWIDVAIDRDREDWRLWLVSARVRTKLGRVGAAERSLRRAIELNPRSPLFARLLEDAGSG